MEGGYESQGCFADSYIWLNGGMEVFNDYVVAYTSDPATCFFYAKMCGGVLGSRSGGSCRG